MKAEANAMHPDPSNIEMLMESIKFFGWLIGSILSLSVTLLGIYLRLYVRDALHDHADAIHALVAQNYVRRDVYEADMRLLRALNEGQA
jgi:hypothetical protein